MSADSGHQRVFVDTNVLFYAFDTSAGVKRERAAALLEELWRQGNGCLSVQVLQEFFVNATRKLPRPLPLLVARELIDALRRWRVHAPDAEDVLAAVDLQQAHGLSFWDAMIVHSAGRLGCAVLYSEDLNPGQVIGGVVIRSPGASQKAWWGRVSRF